jgi:hypothetical protein
MNSYFWNFPCNSFWMKGTETMDRRAINKEWTTVFTYFSFIFSTCCLCILKPFYWLHTDLYCDIFLQDQPFNDYEMSLFTNGLVLKSAFLWSAVSWHGFFCPLIFNLCVAVFKGCLLKESCGCFWNLDWKL